MTPTAVAKALVVARSLPARAAALVAVLTVVSVELVPLLPIAWQAEAAAGIASAVVAIGAVTRTVSRLTEVAEDEIGLLPGVSDIEPDDTPYLIEG